MNRPEIPNFNISTYCGSGAYGDVWLGKDRDGIERAVKVLDIKRLKSMGVLQREEKAVKLFRTQTQRHPNLIEIFYAGSTDHHIYYIMELADSTADGNDTYVPDSLAERLKAGKALDRDDCLVIIKDVLNAVEHLHSNDLIHRDIKPSNVLFVGGTAKLADIGLVSSSSSALSFAGTPGFIPPDGAMGTEADLYAVGKLLYCMYTGKATDEFPSLPDCNDPSELRSIKQINKTILKACDRKPENRFHSADEFRQGLTGNLPRRRFRKRIVFELISLILVLGLCWNYLFRKYKKYNRQQQSNHWLTEARKNAAEGNRSEALRNTAQALKINPENKEAAKLRKILIQQAWKSLPDKPVPSENGKPPALTSAERKQYAQFLILYNTFMTKNNPEKAVECIDSIYKKWPHTRKSTALRKLRKSAVDKQKADSKPH